MLDQRRKRWADVVQMLYKCFVFAGLQMCLLEVMTFNLLFNLHLSAKIAWWITVYFAKHISQPLAGVLLYCTHTHITCVGLHMSLLGVMTLDLYISFAEHISLFFYTAQKHPTDSVDVPFEGYAI